MKYRLTLFLLVFCSISNAQEKLNKLQAPTSPAASILGLQPSAVLSPKSYQALETALYSNLIGENGNAVIPNDFALEFTPYWTKNHSLSLDEYLYPKRLVDQFIRNSSLSIASTQNFLLGDSTATNGLAFGYRTTFYFGNKKDRKEIEKYKSSLQSNQKITSLIGSKSEELINNNKVADKHEFLEKIKSTIVMTINQNMSDLDAKQINTLIDEIITEASMLSFDVNDPDPFLGSFYNIIDDKLKSELLFNSFKTYIKNRQGWSVDIAYANFLNFPSSNFNFSYLPRQSFWLTPTYRFKDGLNFLKIMGVIRYEWYNVDYFKKYFVDSKTYENNFDYGLAISTQFKKFSIKFEMVGRKSETEIPVGTDTDGNELFRRDKTTGFQYLGSFNYNLSDQIILSYSLGNRFEPILNPNNTLVSLLSLNFGFGTPTENTLNLGK
ncbi:MAG: hypothetical protein GXO88_11010 [Chlorobi bacterium]|nr:hypothetical protein [Chlorobiota bacterium]